MLRRSLALALTGTLAVPVALSLSPATAAAPVVDPTTAAARDTEAVVLTGAAFADWAAPGNVTAKVPSTDLLTCPEAERDDCEHNTYVEPEVDTGDAAGTGTPTDLLSGWRWDGERFVEVPFQVDEVFTRYLQNSASGFSIYSGIDEHTSYAFDREGFRWTQSAEGNPCLAVPDSAVAVDPVAGLDTDDELVFMASDAGPQAPAEARTPAGVDSVKAVTVVDPLTQQQSYLYVMRGQAPSFDASNGYVTYTRDANADTFEKSESSYDNYGNAARGIVCDDAGNVITDPATGEPVIERRRPRDYATITTDRYRYRYDGRWLMTEINIADETTGAYGPDLVDRWKARAFQQDAESETPCCGYEEEDTNWGGSSTLLGERSGPVRTVRETWGADSGTNVVRRETFYRAEMTLKTWLRVHVIPPLDGIYAQWDYNAGRMTRFSNPQHPDGVPIDGVNDEAFGNLDDPCNDKYDANGTSELDQGYRELYKATTLCEISPYHQSVDLTDPTFNDVNAALGWTQTSGPWGTIVDRISTQVTDLTPGGAAQSAVAVPYYRDDSCFDDATGTNPGPRLKLRSAGEPTTVPGTGEPRRCWTPADGVVDDDPRFYQGSIGTHGVHLLFLVDSDNARTTTPINEIVFEQRQVFLPGEQTGPVGEQYGRSTEKPLLTSVASASFAAQEEPAPTEIAYDGDTAAGRNAEVELAAVLTSEGAPVVGRTVVFQLDDEAPLEAVTDDTGRAAVRTTYRGRADQRTVTFSFAGDDTHQPSQGSATIRRDGGQSGPRGAAVDPGAALRPAA